MRRTTWWKAFQRARSQTFWKASQSGRRARPRSFERETTLWFLSFHDPLQLRGCVAAFQFHDRGIGTEVNDDAVECERFESCLIDGQQSERSLACGQRGKPAVGERDCYFNSGLILILADIRLQLRCVNYRRRQRARLLEHFSDLTLIFVVSRKHERGSKVLRFQSSVGQRDADESWLTASYSRHQNISGAARIFLQDCGNDLYVTVVERPGQSRRSV